MKYPIKHGGRGLPRISLTDYRFQGKELLKESEKSSVFELQDGSILKLFSPQFLFVSEFCGGDLETKIMDTEKKRCLPEIMSPKCGVYEENNFAGYIMPKAKGVPFSTYLATQTKEDRENLEKYATILAKVENILRRANTLGYVFPDLCSLDNIFIDENGNIELVNYDGMQIRNHMAIETSATFRSQEIFMHKKYRNQKLFTSELDKLSLLFFYFAMTFQIDLGMIGQENPNTGKRIRLSDILQLIGLEEKEIISKMNAILSFHEPGEYFTESAFVIASKYYLEEQGNFGEEKYFKRLVRK